MDKANGIPEPERTEQAIRQQKRAFLQVVHTDDERLEVNIVLPPSRETWFKTPGQGWIEVNTEEGEVILIFPDMVKRMSIIPYPDRTMAIPE